MKKYTKNMLAVVVVVGMVSAAGPAVAGDLNPSAPPGPTMKSLDDVTPSWSQTLPSSQRFKLVLGGAAVLDRETGLVWEKTPSDLSYQKRGAIENCTSKILGDRMGWRLPSVQELTSLFSSEIEGDGLYRLPSALPFSNVPTGFYWTTTASTRYPDTWWVVKSIDGFLMPAESAYFAYMWCVRGGSGADAQ